MRMIYAHDWEILKGERIARWPGPDKREIRVTINSWTGISIGARHWYVEVHEQDNQWWCEDRNAWVELSCDGRRGGYSLKADVFTREEAIALAKHFIAVIAGERRRKHSVVWSGPGRPRWAH